MTCSDVLGAAVWYNPFYNQSGPRQPEQTFSLLPFFLSENLCGEHGI